MATDTSNREGPSNIDIYLRMRPVSTTPAVYEIDHDEGRVQWNVPRQIAAGMANHQKERYDFFFTGIFDTDAKQDAVFETVARKVVLGALDGYNGTMFAYGQTGSGKTFSITGGAERYVDRGIIPRAISLIYSELSRRSEYSYTIHYSYLEIYNEMGIDLLNPNHETKALEDLPKVMLLEDDENMIHLRNLSSHLATNEEEALNLLFVGDTNRMISSTPMNMASSRSHCIFTASIEARRAGEDIVRKSKLHLVDLAGSERVSKTGVDGQILKEAKYINLSLHFLEQVIIALQERNQGKPRQHIPYRNSLMTTVLRDSLGGNCQTVMLATVSIAQDQLEETISTCRFAQRVATISNRVLLNEEIDPNLVIRRLKQEVKDLKAEIQLLRGDCGEELPLTESRVRSLHEQVTSYINDASHEASLKFGASIAQIQTIFQIFKKMICDERCANSESEKPTSDGITRSEGTTEGNNLSHLHETIQELHRKVQERDNEINILVSFIQKHDIMGAKFQQLREIDTKLIIPSDGITSGSTLGATFERAKNEKAGAKTGSLDSSHVNTEVLLQIFPASNPPINRAQAFEIFQRNYPQKQTIQENKLLLKAKYGEARCIGDNVNRARDRIISLKSQIEKQRIGRAMQGLYNGGKSEILASDPCEDQLILEIEAEKQNYKDGFNKLRDLKKEIENIHHLLEQNHLKLQDDFQKWMSIMSRVEQDSKGSSLSTLPMLPSTTSNSSENTNKPTTDDRILELQPAASRGEEVVAVNNEHETSLHKLKPSVVYKTLNSENMQNKIDSSYDRFQEPKYPCAKDISEVLDPSDPRQHKEKSVYRLPLVGASETAGSSAQSKVAALLTGNPTTDAEILAFYEARDKILKLKSQNQKQ